MFLLGLEFIFKLLVLSIGPIIGILGGVFLLLLVLYQYLAKLYAHLTARLRREDTALP